MKNTLLRSIALRQATSCFRQASCIKWNVPISNMIGICDACKSASLFLSHIHLRVKGAVKIPDLYAWKLVWGSNFLLIPMKSGHDQIRSDQHHVLRAILGCCVAAQALAAGSLQDKHDALSCESIWHASICMSCRLHLRRLQRIPGEYRMTRCAELR